MPPPNAVIDCLQLVHRLFTSVDHDLYESIPDLVSSDLSYVTPRRELKGIKELTDSMRARPADQITRHIVANFAVYDTADGRVEGAGYLLMYRAVRKSDATPPAVPPIEAIADVQAVFRLEAHGWRISRMVLKPALAG